MTRSKTALVGALALAGALSAGAAQARERSDVQWSVTIGGPIGVSLYSQPYSGYSQPQPVYAQPYPVYSQPQPVYVQPYPVYPSHHSRPYYQQPTRWDRDGDGIPNRHDPVYNPRWDRDGDGIPNRYDRNDRRDHHDPSWRDERNGWPNWQDRPDGRRGR